MAVRASLRHPYRRDEDQPRMPMSSGRQAATLNDGFRASAKLLECQTWSSSAGPPERQDWGGTAAGLLRSFASLKQTLGNASIGSRELLAGAMAEIHLGPGQVLIEQDELAGALMRDFLQRVAAGLGPGTPQ